MSDHSLDRLRDLEPYSAEWFAMRDRFADEDPDAYARWLDDEWEVDQVLREIEARTE
jgi:hypothetical protein